MRSNWKSEYAVSGFVSVSGNALALKKQDQWRNSDEIPGAINILKKSNKLQRDV